MNEIDNNDEKLSAFYDGEIADNEINDILSMYLFDMLNKTELKKHQLLLGPEILGNDSLGINSTEQSIEL